MRLTQLHWVEGPWPGRLALSARPRGGEWLADEAACWRQAGVGAVMSLLTADEEAELNLVAEADQVRAHAMQFLRFPIRDRDVPDAVAPFTDALDRLEAQLVAGRNVVLHCRQGAGRTGMVAVCLLVRQGFSPEDAVRIVSEARGVPVPETERQSRWIADFARHLSFAHHG
ncbi:MAG: tyrosine protein phosphatase [Acidobacteria bacterium]|nr:tyrosine protein phosphatase [Acidobacteriota bacterium]